MSGELPNSHYSGSEKFDQPPTKESLTSLSTLNPPACIARFVTIDERQRVFRICLPNLGVPDVTPLDALTLSEYVFRLFDVDDIALVLHNAVRGVSPSGWAWTYLETRLGPVMHHKFKRFEAVLAPDGTLTGEFTEANFLAMLFSDFTRYLNAASDLRKWDLRDAAARGSEEPALEFSRCAVPFSRNLLADLDPSIPLEAESSGVPTLLLADSSATPPPSPPLGPPLYLVVHDEKVGGVRAA